jgi:CubicO group peptidase (beta-lactamase class C family)
MTDPRIEAAIQKSIAMGETGVQVAAYLGDQLIVDAWGGVADPNTGRLVNGDTLFCPFSVTKAITVTALHLQAERGLIDYDAPVAKYWPEFAVNGKGQATVRDALSHRAGIPQMPEGVTPQRMCDWNWMVDHIAALTPTSVPGSTNAYHALTFGWIIAEIVVRTDPAHRSFDQFVREEICVPLGVHDFYLGLPDSEFARFAPVLMDGDPVADKRPLAAAAMPLCVQPSAPVANRRDVLRACMPGQGAIMSARAGARLFAMIANGGQLDGVRLISKQRLLSLTNPRPDTDLPDETLAAPVWVGVGGYRLGGAGPSTNPNARSALLAGTMGKHILCHGGAGGSFAWADLDTGLAVSLCHNRMHGGWSAENPLMPIADAIREIVAERLN